MTTHVYLKYAIALLMEEYGLQTEQEITFKEIKEELEKGLNTFSVKPIGDYCGQTKVQYGFTKEKNDAKKYIFLAPNTITSEMKASNLYNAVCETCSEENFNLLRAHDITQSEVPISGEFNRFTDKGTFQRGKSKATVFDQCLALITSTTALKACLQYKSGARKKSMDNTCLIPDLDIPDLQNFIKLFKRIRVQKLDSSLMVGKVKCEKGKTLKYTPKRPNIFNGNFPNAPHSSALGSIALLGAIGEMTKEKDVSELAKKVLESLKDCNFYAIKYGDASVFSFSHLIIRLAERGKLRRIVDSLYYVELYKEGRRTTSNAEYQKFDLFASRFLQIFNRPTFNDFLAFRAEYPYDIELLLNTYFWDMEKIDKEIVTSAKELGKWLNYVAYRSAQKEVGTSSSWEELTKAKAKVLVELESSIFSAKSGDALVAHTITRAGRLSGLDAPAAASLFMEEAASGELPLEQAKNLLIAFSRLKSKNEEIDNSSDGQSIENEEMTEDYSNI